MKKLSELCQLLFVISKIIIFIFFIAILIILVGFLFSLIKVNTNLDMPDSLRAVLIGVLIFSLGQIIIRFIIEPFQNYKKLVGEISVSLIYFSGISSTELRQMINYRRLADARGMPTKEEKEVHTSRVKKNIADKWDYADLSRITLRKQASELLSITNTIQFYWLWRVFKLVPTQKDIINTSRNLFLLSNVSTSYSTGLSTKMAKESIAKTLNMKIVYEYLRG